MHVTLDEVKWHLRLEGNEENVYLDTLIDSVECICMDILRVNPDHINKVPDQMKIGVLYGVTYLYENRENADFKELIATLKHLLYPHREEMF